MQAQLFLFDSTGNKIITNSPIKVIDLPNDFGEGWFDETIKLQHDEIAIATGNEGTETVLKILFINKSEEGTTHIIVNAPHMSSPFTATTCFPTSYQNLITVTRKNKNKTEVIWRKNKHV